MNVLVLADTRFPIERANGVQTMATCHALAERGHHVTLVVRADTAHPARDPFAFYGLPPNPRLEIEAITTLTNVRARRAAFLFGAARIALARRGDVVFTRDLGCASMLLQLPRGRRPRVLYESHGVSVVVAREMPRLLGKPETTPSADKLRRLERREARVWKDADAYVTITRLLAADLESKYGPRQRVFVVPDGAAGGQTPAAPPLNKVPTARPVAAYAGHLYPWKGVDVFIRAVGLAPAVDGLVIGGHPDESDRVRVDALITELKLGGRVTLTGLVPPAQVRSTLDASDILVLPNTTSSISERYTSPLKLFEYLTLGRPIVASDLPAIREILTDRRTALLVRPDDPQALADALTRLAGEPALARSLGEAAARLAPDYTWARRAERLEAALNAAVR